MPSIPQRSSPSRKGFLPLSTESQNAEMNQDIPLDYIRSNSGDSTMKAQSTFPGEEGEKKGFFSRTPGGRRRLKKTGTNASSSREDSEVTGLGRIYSKIVDYSVVTRYFFYVLPVGAVIAVPIVIGATVAPNAKIAGVKLLWFFTWIEIVWLSIWIARIIAKTLPHVFLFLCGVISSGTRKYALIIQNLEIPISLILWAAASFATFSALTASTNLGNDEPEEWVGIVKNILAALLICSGIYFAEKFLVQLIAVSYHQRSYALRIAESKHAVHLLGLLFDASRTLFPMYCPEFQAEDYLINDSLESILNGAFHKKNPSGSATPMKIIGGLGRLGDKVTGVVGTVANELFNKHVFNPNSAHSIVVEALEKKSSSEALAKRIWMSMVVEGKQELYPEDLKEVLGPGRAEEAEEAFAAIDTDGNGDISLDEMIMKVVEISTTRTSIANSMKDIDQAISTLDQLLIFIVFIMSVLVMVSFLNTSFVTTLATAGTTLLSLSFVFAITVQEVLGSCIFLFVKHPYDVGDRVDIVGPAAENLVVSKISLLFTVFVNISSMKSVQVPNIVLNTLWIENISRSRAMKEQLELDIAADSSLEDVELLRSEMEAFVRANSRDFQEDVITEIIGVGSLDKLQLRIEIRHKSNWANESLRASRRSKFFCALLLAARKVPIYAPGGGGEPLGGPSNPSYAVAISDDIAAEAREKASKAKNGKRLVPAKDSPTPTGKSTSLDYFGSPSEAKAAEALNLRKPADDGNGDGSREATIENLRNGLLQRASTRGRRRPGETLPPLAIGQTATGISLTAASPRAPGFDEESGIEGRTFNNQPYGGGGPVQMTASAPMAPGQSGSYSIYPPADRPRRAPSGSRPPQQGRDLMTSYSSPQNTQELE